MSQQQGGVTAITNLGFMHQFGVGVSINDTKARTLYVDAAAKACSESLYRLGLIYSQGDGVNKNLAKAIEYLGKAALLLHPDALTLLGTYFAKGQGVKQDKNKAKQCFNLAIKLGNGDAANELGHLYYQHKFVTNGSKQNYLFYYRLGVSLGSVAAKNSLGMLYQLGKKVAPDYNKAFYYLLQAHQAGCSNATNNLAYLHEAGQGIAKDEQKAIKLYRQAIRAGNLLSLFNLANKYFGGRGVKKNERVAARMYRVGAERGSSDCINSLQLKGSTILSYHNSMFLLSTKKAAELVYSNFDTLIIEVRFDCQRNQRHIAKLKQMHQLIINITCLHTESEQKKLSQSQLIQLEQITQKYLISSLKLQTGVVILSNKLDFAMLPDLVKQSGNLQQQDEEDIDESVFRCGG